MIMEIELETEDSENPTQSDLPQPHQKEWQPYVMSKFTKDELVNGHPKVNGLRRVVEEVFGPIVESRVHIVSEPNQYNNYTAVAQYAVTIDCIRTNDKGGLTRTFSSAADSNDRNTDELFRLYKTAIAETRAEGRALRKALKLDKAAAEELSEVAKLDKEMISSIQLMALDRVLKRKNISKTDLEKERGLLTELTSVEAKELLKELQERG